MLMTETCFAFTLTTLETLNYSLTRNSEAVHPGVRCTSIALYYISLLSGLGNISKLYIYDKTEIQI